jgi:hypothetical protein
MNIRLAALIHWNRLIVAHKGPSCRPAQSKEDALLTFSCPECRTGLMFPFDAPVAAA